MYSYTKKWDEWVYNQNTINDFGPDCTMASIAQIFGLNYDVWVEEKTLAELVIMAIENGVLTSAGASFSVIYPYIAEFVTTYTQEPNTVYKTYIGNSKLKEMLDKGYSFGIGLKNGNSKYLEAVENGELTTDDVDAIINKGGGFAHNHCFGTKDGDYGIFEIYKGKFVKCSLETLEYGVNKGIWRSPARTFKFSDELLEKALFNYKAEINIENVQDLSIEEQEVISRASKLRVFKK